MLSICYKWYSLENSLNNDPITENVVNNSKLDEHLAEGSLSNEGVKESINLRGELSSLDELKKIVSEIETEIGDYEVEIDEKINENTNIQVNNCRYF